MKVRHKDNHKAEYACLGEGTKLGSLEPYWIGLDDFGHFAFFPKSHFEPVPEEQWIDVTATFRENHWKRADYYISEGPTLALTEKYDGYRLRKVTVLLEEDARKYGDLAFAGFRSAFIIEKLSKCP